MKKFFFLFLTGVLTISGFGLASIVYAAESDPCSLLRDAEIRMMLGGALETRLMIQCGEITEEQLEMKRRDVRGEADVAPPVLGEAPGTINILVNNPALDSGGTTQSETTIVAVGNILCAAWNDSGERMGANGFSGFGFSSDGGVTWTDGGFFPNGPFDSNGGDPSLAYSDRDSAFYYAALSTKGLSLWKSTNNCQGFSYVGPIHTGGGDDKELMAIDNNPSSPFYGRIYVAWTDFNFGGRIRNTFSDDGGANWSAPVTLSKVGTEVQGAWPAVAPNGDVYVSWVRWQSYPNGPIDIEVVRSTNGGVSFAFRTNPLTNAVNPRDNVDTRSCGRPALNGEIRYLPSPQIVVGPTGTVHIVYSYDPDVNGVGDVVNVYYRRSTDQGASWGPEVQLNDDETTTDQWFPAIAVNENGVVVASWYDRRLDPINNLAFDRFAVISMDGGLNWGANIRVSNISSPVSINNPHFDGLAECYHGDYDQVALGTTTAHILWSDDRRITSTGPNPDIYYDSLEIGSGNGNPGDSCGSGKVLDCELNCVDSATAQSYIGDGYCDDGTWGYVLTCPEFDNDGGDCGGGGNPGDSCGSGKVLDCELNCVDSATAQSYIGDGYCDDGTWGYVLTCPEFDNDGGDCGSGGNPGDNCGSGKVLDCELNCVDSAIAQSYIGDGYCDDGTWGYVLTCPEFDNDGGDCGGGGNPGDSCGSGKVLDCELNCVDSATAQSYIGDGYCDDGTWGYVLTCPEFDDDGGDCGGG